jgi:hypothetical protein
MIGYATITNGSFLGDLTDNLNKFIQWYSDLPAYWVVASVVLFFFAYKDFSKTLVKHV